MFQHGRPLKRRPRAGMMMLINMVLVLLLALIMAFILNSGKTIKRKTEGQQAADAVAYSVGLQKARALNVITSTNHAMGEMMAMLIVHHALGGDLLDEGKKAEQYARQRGRLNRLNSELDEVYKTARTVGARTPAYTTVRQKRGIRAEATILRAKMNLKKYLIAIYQAKIAAKAMQAYPPTRPAGHALEKAMDALEQEVLAEYRVLNQFARIARSLLPVKERMRDIVLPDAKRFTREVVRQAPVIIEQTASELVRRYGASEGFVVDPTLPVQIDPLAHADTLPRMPAADRPQQQCCQCLSKKTSITRDQIVKVTQLARATFPWVAYHREPVWRDLARLAPLSQAEDYYKDYTDGYAKVLCDRYQTDHRDLGLFVPQDDAPPDKGWEIWTEQRVPADALFGTLVVVRMRPDPVVGSVVYAQDHPHGQFYYAQSMNYNANPQRPHPHRIDLRCKRISPNRQAAVGFDTLNWAPYTRQQQMPWELIAKTDQGGKPTPEFPQVRLNWQVKLVPASAEQLSALKQSSRLPGNLRPLAVRLMDNVPGTLLSH